jgi:hypothetical protein
MPFDGVHKPADFAIGFTKASVETSTFSVGLCCKSSRTAAEPP